MKKHFYLLWVLAMVLPACNSSAGQPAQIPVTVPGYLSGVSIYKEAYQSKDFLLVSGTVQEPMGKKLERAAVAAYFYNEAGEKIAEARTKVDFVRVRSGKKSSGKFSLKTPYVDSIKSCRLELVWEGTVL